MDPDRQKTLARAIAVSVCLSPIVLAQGAAPSPTVFAPPVRLQAGGKFLGENRLFPSPVFHDVNGDGLADIVVGDLIGHLTVALRQPGDGPARHAAETTLTATDGKQLNFANW